MKITVVTKKKVWKKVMIGVFGVIASALAFMLYGRSIRLKKENDA